MPVYQLLPREPKSLNDAGTRERNRGEASKGTCFCHCRHCRVNRRCFVDTDVYLRRHGRIRDIRSRLCIFARSSFSLQELRVSRSISHDRSPDLGLFLFFFLVFLRKLMNTRSSLSERRRESTSSLPIIVIDEKIVLS